ncbi:17054_t:CDS:1 [Cetraspora pellucida]|uniref:17054_t:CDS:1 n=1 Tax=Cetraspora pellucida TaxID=1433469 RepID=A0A9N9DY68_9GLOM|nr:17054_t:CDS:1 [Cetraspora pellucida]
MVNDWLLKVQAKIDWTTSEITLTWQGKEVTVPVEFKKLNPKPLGKNHSKRICNVKESEEKTNTDEFDKSDDFEEEKLENKIYNYSRIKDSDNPNSYPKSNSSCNINPFYNLEHLVSLVQISLNVSSTGMSCLVSSNLICSEVDCNSSSNRSPGLSHNKCFDSDADEVIDKERRQQKIKYE